MTDGTQTNSGIVPAGRKKVLLIVADSLMYQAIDEGIKRHQLPTLQFLIDNGQYYRDLVSSFPTMSVTIDSSLVTGTYPDEHRVPGLIWFSSEEKRIVNYGTGPMEIWHQGINQVLTDAIRNLNGKHLSCRTPTLYEDLAARGLQSGSINGLVYRGTTKHVLAFPPYVQALTSLPKEIEVRGPDLLSFGAFSDPFDADTELPDGPLHKFGMDNQYAVQTVRLLAESGRLPDFLYVYLSDMDQRLHRHGPPDVKGAIQLEKYLLSLLEAFGSKEDALQKAVFILMGDSGVSSIVPSQQDPVIPLHRLLEPYHVMKPGAEVARETQVVLAVNETMAYVYWLQEDAERYLQELADLLTAEPRIDLVAWNMGEWIRVRRVGYDGELRFRSQGHLVDSYRQSWTLEGEHRILDLSQDLNGQLVYGEYPDGLRRLSAALQSHEGHFLVVTAKPGYELAGHSSPAHKGGGGHGAFHRAESFIPLIICGTQVQPEHRRIVDLKNYLLRLCRAHSYT